MRLRKLISSAIISIVAAAIPLTGFAQTSPSFHATVLPKLPGTVGCIPYAINDAGTVVGYCFLGSFNYQAVVWRNGTVTPLGLFPKGHYSDATAINSLGTKIVGDADMGDIQPKPFLAAGGALANIDLQGGSNIRACGILDSGVIFGNFTSSGSGSTSSWTPVYWIEDPKHPGRYQRFSLPKPASADKSAQAFAQTINHIGQVVGYASSSTTGQHAVIWNNDAAHSLIDLPNLPTGNQSYGNGINDLGQVAGEAAVPFFQHAAMWDNDAAHTLTDLGMLDGDTDSIAQAINNSAQVIGTSTHGTFSRAFFYQNGTMQNLVSLIDPADGISSIPNVWSINNAGQIVGTTPVGGYMQAVLLTPITQ